MYAYTYIKYTHTHTQTYCESATVWANRANIYLLLLILVQNDSASLLRFGVNNQLVHVAPPDRLERLVRALVTDRLCVCWSVGLPRQCPILTRDGVVCVSLILAKVNQEDKAEMESLRDSSSFFARCGRQPHTHTRTRPTTSRHFASL
ncbi:unnamed protein product [Protopolystoma xenopodis]|uniref:Uncharacterized protein n=1 Tax=Protopolystoma xenopodis TaxID=117903 RepID=A0A448XT05_9PLAT|nr:unnamed protein product [Protopolystoma xenopodis]